MESKRFALVYYILDGNDIILYFRTLYEFQLFIQENSFHQLCSRDCDIDFGRQRKRYIPRFLELPEDLVRYAGILDYSIHIYLHNRSEKRKFYIHFMNWVKNYNYRPYRFGGTGIIEPKTYNEFYG